jgi:sugar lactone lactonase YvrE
MNSTHRSVLLGVTLLVAFFVPFSLKAQNVTLAPTITTVAGNGTAGTPTGTDGDGGQATSANLTQPSAVVKDSAGNLYIADFGNNRVRKVTPAGVVSTVAGNGNVGTPTGTNGDGGSAISAPLNKPVAVALDGSGNLYIADSGNNRIRRVNTLGVISTVAGNGNVGTTTGNDGDGAAAISAQLNAPSGVTLDSSGNIYIGDFGNNRIRVVNTIGNISTVAGTGDPGFTSGPATSSELNGPDGVRVDRDGNIYIADQNNGAIREVGDGTLLTVAGTGAQGYNGDNQQAISAQLNAPNDVQIDSAGNIYIADFNNNRVRKIDVFGTITTFAGTGVGGFNGDNLAAVSAELNGPAGLTTDAAGNLYIADVNNNRVRKVNVGSVTFGLVNIGSNSTQTVILSINNTTETLISVAAAGDYSVTSNSCPLNEGLAPGTMCTLQVKFTPTKPGPRNFALKVVDNTATQYSFGLEGLGGGSAAAFTPGLINSYAGNGAEDSSGFGGDGQPATNPAVLLGMPTGAKMDSAGNLYIADTNNNRVREVNTSGIINTVVGNGTAGFNGDFQSATDAEINAPAGVAVDSAGNFYIADTTNNRVRKVDTDGMITTVTGDGNANYEGDGGSAVSAEVNAPTDVAVDAAGNIYIADSGNNRVRKVDTSGNISLVAGDGTATPATGDGGPATAAQLSVWGIAIDAAGNLYIGDYQNHQVRQVNPNGLISAFAGDGTSGYSGDGGPALSSNLNTPEGVAVDDAGDVYIADTLGTIRKVDTLGIITTVAGAALEEFSGDGGPATAAGLDHPAGIFVDNLGNLFISDTRSSVIREVNVARSPVVFPGNTSPGNTSAPVTMAVSNVGTAPLNFSSIATSTNFGVTAVGSPCTIGSPQTVGSTCNIGVDFAPTTTGNPLTGTLTVNDDATNSPQIANLSGNTNASTAPTITSASSATFLFGTDGSFTVTTTGSPTPSLSETPPLPANVTFVDNGDGTATISGIPQSSGTFPINITATNGVNPDATQAFTLNVSTEGTVDQLTVTLLGMGTGTVTDNTGSVTCSEVNGEQTDASRCLVDYSDMSMVTFTAAPSGGSTFGGWGGACAFAGSSPTCKITLTGATSVTADFIAPPQSVNLVFTPGTNVIQTAGFNCPGNPNPITPSNPCTPAQGPNADAFEVQLAQVFQPFTMTVTKTEFVADGLCPNTDNISNPADFDCRFKQFFNYGQDGAAMNTITPYCDHYANGNCAHYDIYYCVPQVSGPCVPTPGQEPPPADYVNAVALRISWNNSSNLPPSPTYTGSLPRLYDDPDFAFLPTSAFGTNCGTPMLIGSTPQPYSCQFEFDVTTFFDVSGAVDPSIGGTIRQFNDLVVAFPPTVGGTGGTVTPTNPVAPNTITGNCVAGCALSSTTATFTVGMGGTFALTGNGFPVSTLTHASGTLPTGLTFFSTTGLISGTPAAGTAGTYPITVKATNSQGSITKAFTIVVNNPGSTLRISPSSLTFGTVRTGETELAATLLTNTGPTMITFTNFAVKPIAGDDSSGFLGIELCPRTLNPGKSCPIIMSFTGDSNVTATHAANLVITDNATGSPQTIPMTVTAVINPRVSLSPSSLNFGTVKAGHTSATKTVTLTNSGTTTLKLSGLSISGNFAFASGAGACTSSTQLTTSGHCTIYVVFNPTSRGSKSGSVRITDNALNSPQSISLSGTGN